LGETGPDVEGKYSISYKLKDDKALDLKVRAYQDETLIAYSDIVYNAGKKTEINLIEGNLEYKGASEYQILDKKLSSYLSGFDLEKLTVQKVDYLVEKTGANAERVKYYVWANYYAKKVEHEPQLFYACFRHKLPTELKKFLQRSPKKISSTVSKAVDENIINEKWLEKTESFITQLTQYKIKTVLTID